MGEPDCDGVIPEDKIRAAYEFCMRDSALAKYFDEAPPGARQYIALMFYCTVYQAEVDDAKCAAYQAEVEADLTKDDLLYLATHERNRESKAHFRELYAEMVRAEQSDAAASPAALPSGPVVIDTRAVEAELREVRGEVQMLRGEVQQLRRLVAVLVARVRGAVVAGLVFAGVLLVLLLFLIARA